MSDTVPPVREYVNFGDSNKRPIVVAVAGIAFFAVVVFGCVLAVELKPHPASVPAAGHHQHHANHTHHVGFKGERKKKDVAIEEGTHHLKKSRDVHHHEDDNHEDHPQKGQKDEPKLHDGKRCKGGPLNACRCMLECKVFGAQPRKCEVDHESDRAKMLNHVLENAMIDQDVACDGMRCIVACTRKLDCLDKYVQLDCHKLTKNTNCNVNCGKDENPQNKSHNLQQ